MRKKPTWFTLLLWALLAALLVALFWLLPGTLESYRALQTEQNATPTPTADIRSMLLVTADPNLTPAPTTLLLRVGVSGDEVLRLQQRLKELGYYAGELDGQFGQGTADAVRAFQAQHGLTSDGIAGAETLGKVYASDAQTYVPTAAPTQTPSVLSKGDKGETVKSMQQRLKELGFYAGDVDGDFGGGTQEAVRLFQNQHGLLVDGIAADQTLSALYSDAAKRVVVTPTPDPASLPLLVNREHPVASDYKPADLVLLRNVLPTKLVYVKGSEIEGDRTAVAALRTMLEAAQADGVGDWQVSAGYRSLKYQQSLFDKQVNAYIAEGKSKQNAISATKLTVAEPGASEHHTGLAFDMTVADTIFKGTKQQLWLEKNCWDYGFVIRYQEDKEKITGFIAECWHIRYVGAQASAVMRDRNLCLEEYVALMTGQE